MRSLARHLFIYARKLAIADSEFDPIALAGIQVRDRHV